MKKFTAYINGQSVITVGADNKERARLEVIGQLDRPGRTGILARWNETGRMVAERVEAVDLVASGYEWVCPCCEELNHEIEVTEHVICPHCNVRYSANPPEHAYS